MATQAVGGEIRKKKMEMGRWRLLQPRNDSHFDMVGIQILNDTWQR